MLRFLYFIIIIGINNQLGNAQKTDFNNKEILKFESPYEIKLGKTIGLYAVGIAGRLGGEAIIRNLDPLTADDIANLNPDNINFLDKGAINNLNNSARVLSDVIRNGSYAIPLVTFFDKQMGHNWAHITIIGAQALTLNSAVSVLTKGLSKRTRPFAYNPNTPVDERESTAARLSFLSGHTSTTAVMSFVTAKFFSDFYPNSPLRPYFWGGATILTVTAGYLRYAGGKHFVTDVVAGGVVGAAIGILLPQSYKKRQLTTDITYNLISVGNGIGLHLTF